MSALIAKFDMRFQVLCTLDLEKAYDRVNWDILLHLLRWCGFGETLGKGIAHFLSTVRFSILLNITPSNFFNSSCSLSRGSFLPPPPCCLSLARKPWEECCLPLWIEGCFLGFTVGSRNNYELLVSHLLFANETLVLCEANLDHLDYHRCLCFEVVWKLIWLK